MSALPATPRSHLGYLDDERHRHSNSSSWTRGRSWTKEEVENLCEMASVHTISTIAALLARSEMAVRLKLKSLKFEHHDLAGFKVKDLAAMLQVTIRQVRRWRHRGYLASINGRITEDSFTRFCRFHANKIPYADLDDSTRLWLRGFDFRPD